MQKKTFFNYKFISNYTILLIFLLTMISTLALHIIVPLTPEIAKYFHTTDSKSQQAITIYLLGLVFGQLFYGHLSERYGRKPILLIGLIIYIIGTLLGVLSQSINFFLFSRFIQGLGACSSLVIGRAMIRELSDDKQATQRFSLLSTIMSLTPALAPFLGSKLYNIGGWKIVFIFLLVIITVLLFISFFKLPETLVKRKSLISKSFIKNESFIKFVLIGSFNSTSIYGFLAAAPFIFKNKYLLDINDIGEICLVIVLGVSLGSFLSNRFSKNYESFFSIKIGLFFSILGSFFMIFPIFTNNLTIYIFLLIFYSLGVGLITPNAISILMKVGINSAGLASSIYGVIQMTTGVLFTLIVSLCDNSTPQSLSIILFITSIVNLLLLITPFQWQFKMDH